MQDRAVSSAITSTYEVSLICFGRWRCCRDEHLRQHHLSLRPCHMVKWSLDSSVSQHQLRKCTSPNDHKGNEEELGSGRLNYARSYFFQQDFCALNKLSYFLSRKVVRKTYSWKRGAAVIRIPLCRARATSVSALSGVFVRLIEKFQG
jgi:hypothetical protein